MNNPSIIPNRCKTCAVYHEALNSDEPAICAWYIEHCVLDSISVSKCPHYKEERNDG